MGSWSIHPKKSSRTGVDHRTMPYERTSLILAAKSRHTGTRQTPAAGTGCKLVAVMYRHQVGSTPRTKIRTTLPAEPAAEPHVSLHGLTWLQVGHHDNSAVLHGLHWYKFHEAAHNLRVQESLLGQVTGRIDKAASYGIQLSRKLVASWNSNDVARHGIC